MNTDIDALDADQLAALIDLLIAGLIFGVYYAGHELTGTTRPLGTVGPPPAETYSIVNPAGAGCDHESVLHHWAVSW